MKKNIRRMVVVMVILLLVLASVFVFAEDEREEDFIRLVYNETPQIENVQFCA